MGQARAPDRTHFDRLPGRDYPVRRLERHEAVWNLPSLSAGGLPASVLPEPNEGRVELARMVPELEEMSR